MRHETANLMDLGLEQLQRLPPKPQMIAGVVLLIGGVAGAGLLRDTNWPFFLCLLVAGSGIGLFVAGLAARRRKAAARERTAQRRRR